MQYAARFANRGSGRILVVAGGLLLLAAAPLAAQPDAGQIDRPSVEDRQHRAPDGLTMRVRPTAMTPDEPTLIQWRYGGEGQGGDVIRGTFRKPGVADNGDHRLKRAEWSEAVEVAALAPRRFPRKLFLTHTAGSPGRVIDRVTRARAGYTTGVVFEFEFGYRGRVVRRFVEAAPDGGTATIVIPAYRLVGDVQPDSPEFLDELTGVLDYATRRAEMLESLPWAGGPLPARYAIVNNIGGYGLGTGYGIRHTNPAVTRAEMRSLRQLGVNGFRGAPDFLEKMIADRDPAVADFTRVRLEHVMGFPAPVHRAGRPSDPEAGCPFGQGVPERTREGVAHSLEAVLSAPVNEVWGLTVDEIGAVIDRSPEGKAHLAECPRCARGFQEWLRAKGRTPGDFGQADWSAVRPLNVWDRSGERPWLDADNPGAALAAYETRDFVNHVTAMMFTELRDAFAAANDRKRQALAGGESDSRAARQPWVHSFALRGNTFLMRGHSLDFFDFYRLADNAVVYETSNREPRIWSWDSYLCDVQRVVAGEMGLARGIYIKPHRGAPLQRMLSAVSRGNTMIYWYTYGPDYSKGDSFSQDDATLRLTSKAAHLLGRAEEALYGSQWMHPAEVAVVKPETTQRWMNLSDDPPHLTAAWENAKWTYTALQHAHVPVDPIDEHILATADLSRYKAVYVSGSHLTRAAAEGLERYVAAGGTLYTSGWGLARDEVNRPLSVLEPVLGLKERREPEMWYSVSLYGATSIEPYDDPRRGIAPDGAKVIGRGTFENAEFQPVVGREKLVPADEAEVLATFADGSAAAVRHRYGRGEVYVIGFYPGLEYSATVRRSDYNMARDFDGDRQRFVSAPALARVQRVVETSAPLVEGILLTNPANGLRAVTLANWAYGTAGARIDSRGRTGSVIDHLPAEDVTVTIRGAGDVAEVRSCALERELEFSRRGEALVIRLPRLEEGDVLVLR